MIFFLNVWVFQKILEFFFDGLTIKIFNNFFEIFWVARFFYFNNYYIQKCPYKVGTTWPWRFPLGCKSGYFLDWWTWLNINLSVLENLSWMKNISYSMYYFQTLKQSNEGTSGTYRSCSLASLLRKCSLCKRILISIQRAWLARVSCLSIFEMGFWFRIFLLMWFWILNPSFQESYELSWYI